MNRFCKVLIISFVLTAIFLTCFSIRGKAQAYEDYAPIFYFEKEENCYPVAVEYLFNELPSEDPRSSITIDEDVVYFLDNPHGTVNDNGVIEHYKSKEQSLGYTVYYREDIDPSTGTRYVQYWLFYAFNDGEHNRHEGDWEMVQVVIPSYGEKWVGYSQHYLGQKATWRLVEKEGNHIKVYVARGSHANYLRSYSGKIGIANDIVGDNGKILRPSDYELVELKDQFWLSGDYEKVLWGEVSSKEDFIKGQAGPQGPKARADMNGNLMWDGISWGNGLMEANENLFTAEFILYHLAELIILIFLAILAITLFRIYRRHKKYGLGPKIVSLAYIDGFNLKSIGNILFIFGIIVAIFGIFNQWYVISIDLNIQNTIKTGPIDLISIDGLNGAQITLPGAQGPVPMGAIVVPIYLILLVGIVFTILATVGINSTRKLGKKYIFKGIRLVIIVVIILAIIVIVGLIIGKPSSEGAGKYLEELIGSISSNPIGGSTSFNIREPDFTGQISAQWGLGIGGILLLISGIIMIIAGIVEIIDNKTLFEPRAPIEKKAEQKPSKE